LFLTCGDCFFPGQYLYVDNSYGSPGSNSLVWFNVDLSDETEASHYLFAYHMFGDGVGSLVTFYRDVSHGYGPVINVPVYNEDIWIQSECYSLPSGFKGEIYFRATKGATIYGDIALDNIRVSQEACPSRC